MRKKFRLPSPAMTVACIALAVALSGASYAAVTLPRNSVGTKQLKKNAVTAKKIKGNAVTSAKIAPETVGSADIATDAVGSSELGANSVGSGEVIDGSLQASDLASGLLQAQAFARVDENAARTLEPDDAGFAPQVKNITQADVVAGEGGAATGTTCFNLPSRPASAMVVIDNADAAANVDKIASVAIDRGEDLGDCPASHNDARVRIVDTDLTAGGAEQDPGPANARFFVWFLL